MRRFASVTSLVMLFALAACSRNATVESESVQPSASDAVGVYDFSASLGGDTQTGRFEIERTGGVLGGRIYLDDEPEPAQITSVTTSGDTMILEATPPDGTNVVFTLTFTGASFTGHAAANGMTIPLTGAKRAS